MLSPSAGLRPSPLEPLTPWPGALLSLLWTLPVCLDRAVGTVAVLCCISRSRACCVVPYLNPSACVPQWRSHRGFRGFKPLHWERKIIKTVATRCHILRLKCTKFDFAPTSKGREGRGREKGRAGEERGGVKKKRKEPPPLHISGYATGVRVRYKWESPFHSEECGLLKMCASYAPCETL